MLCRISIALGSLYWSCGLSPGGAPVNLVSDEFLPDLTRPSVVGGWPDQERSDLNWRIDYTADV